MKIKVFIFTYMIFCISSILFGFFIIYEQNKIPKLNNLIDLSEEITELSLEFSYQIADNQIEFLEFIINPDLDTYNQYKQTIKEENLLFEKILKKILVLESLKHYDYENLKNLHEKEEIEKIQNSFELLSKKRNNITNIFENYNQEKIDSKIVLEQIIPKILNLKKEEIKELDDIYDEIELYGQVKEFIINHKFINKDLKEKKETIRKKSTFHLTILITLFSIISFISLFRFKNEFLNNKNQEIFKLK